MSKGLKLDQFKEPAFSSDILLINSSKIYINATYYNLESNNSNNSNESAFKLLLPLNHKVNKYQPIASKVINIGHYKNFNFFAHKDLFIKDVKFLLDEHNNVSSFITLDFLDDNNDDDNENFIFEDHLFINLPLADLSIKKLIDLCYDAAIIDETDGEFLFKKLLNLSKNISHKKIYIDAIDDQPYTSSKESLLLHYPNALNFAIQSLNKIFNLNSSIIFYDLESYNRDKPLPKKFLIMTPIVGLKVNYPARHHISKKLSYDINIGVQAILHLARLLFNNNYKQTTTFLTVAGSAIANPRNIEVPIGTPVRDIIGQFNLISQPDRIILGQVITGNSLSEDDTPISSVSRSILAFTDHILQNPMACIGCSRCSDVCPQNLLPSYRLKFIESKNRFFKYFADSDSCLHCYCCSYICPSHLNLV